MKNRMLNLRGNGDGAAALPVAKQKATGKRRAENWLHVNIGDREAKQLRAMAECYGIELRGFLLNAVRDYTMHVEKLLKLKKWDVVNLPRRRRLEIGRRFWEIQHALGCYCYDLRKIN